ncbi:hypothetical protein BO71DRAFT_8707 [Aspergillus ellipticus CBS 707.79]|uniref:Uncharacterized protein n=1 Tax=Aspergillus ellipticus CBS 707.79 TaxID=1448320 RepID=A0A319D6H3_9EURO|nr:hypothetical protein BO71DRAFT_8707 [Aspergillus ellipticus CBS 707.79]
MSTSSGPTMADPPHRLAATALGQSGTRACPTNGAPAGDPSSPPSRSSLSHRNQSCQSNQAADATALPLPSLSPVLLSFLLLSPLVSLVLSLASNPPSLPRSKLVVRLVASSRRRGDETGSARFTPKSHLVISLLTATNLLSCKSRASNTTPLGPPSP